MFYFNSRANSAVDFPKMLTKRCGGKMWLSLGGRGYDLVKQEDRIAFFNEATPEEVEKVYGQEVLRGRGELGREYMQHRAKITNIANITGEIVIIVTKDMDYQQERMWRRFYDEIYPAHLSIVPGDYRVYEKAKADVEADPIMKEVGIMIWNKKASAIIFLGIEPDDVTAWIIDQRSDPEGTTEIIWMDVSELDGPSSNSLDSGAEARAD